MYTRWCVSQQTANYRSRRRRAPVEKGERHERTIQVNWSKTPFFSLSFSLMSLMQSRTTRWVEDGMSCRCLFISSYSWYSLNTFSLSLARTQSLFRWTARWVEVIICHEQMQATLFVISEASESTLIEQVREGERRVNTKNTLQATETKRKTLCL